MYAANHSAEAISTRRQKKGSYLNGLKSVPPRDRLPHVPGTTGDCPRDIHRLAESSIPAFPGAAQGAESLSCAETGSGPASTAAP
jgi:hypothetical protein